MSPTLSDETPPGGAADYHRLLAAYKEPDLRASVLQLVTTAVPLVGIWLLMYRSLAVGYWLTLTLAVPAAFFLIRLFIIQHDCGHGAFFKSSRAADTVGFLIGVLTLTPYHYWRKTHAMHHATSGNLEHRGFGDIDTYTVAEYLRLSPWRRLRYRLYRHPLVLFGVGAAFHFLVRHRIPTIVPRAWTRERRSIIWTDLALALLVALMGLAVGFKPFLMVQLPISLLSCSIGVWLFYVQHQFEDTYWEHDERWDFHAAGMRGSSYYELPKFFRWLTGNIGLHHIHHLNSRIPNYRLPKIFAAHPAFQRVTRLTFRQSLRCISLALWDERQRKLVSFRHLKGLRAR